MVYIYFVCVCVSVCTSPKDPRFLSILTWKVFVRVVPYIYSIYISQQEYAKTLLHWILYNLNLDRIALDILWGGKCMSKCMSHVHIFCHLCRYTYRVNGVECHYPRRLPFKRDCWFSSALPTPFQHWSNILQLHPKAVCKICMSKFVLRSAGFPVKCWMALKEEWLFSSNFWES